MSESASLARFLDAMNARRGGAAPWLGALRDQARAGFAARGLPTRRVEAWKYSDLARSLDETPQCEGEARAPLDIPATALAHFENGVLDEARSDLAKVGAVPLRQVLADPVTPYAALIGQINPQPDHGLLGLNTALMEDGLVLHLKKGERLDLPLHLRFSWPNLRAPEGRHLRVLVILDEGAQVTLIESHAGNPGFASVASELKLGAGAKLTHIRLERLSAAARQAAMSVGSLDKGAIYRGFYLSEGGYFARHEALIALDGEGAEAHLDGAAILSGSRHCDNTTVITHAAPRCASRQAFRAVLTGKARGIYQGCVRVRPDAQGTDARQMSRALLLSRGAEAVTKPELEILADDVKCAHGATTGELDPAALFFLRARGIPEGEARALLLEGFLAEALAAIESAPLRVIAEGVVQDWLTAHAGEVSHVE